VPETASLSKQHIFDSAEFRIMKVPIKGSVFWEITPCSRRKSAEVSEEDADSIYRVEE
jgi:hypothetical protein